MHYLINGQLCKKTKVQQGQEKNLSVYSLWVMDKNGHLKIDPHNLFTSSRNIHLQNRI